LAVLAVTVTVVPDGNEALQLAGQLIPAGVLVTVPRPTTTTANVDGVAATAGGAATKSDKEPAVRATSDALIRSRPKASGRVIDVPRRAILNI
jgi:hypothetical protein